VTATLMKGAPVAARVREEVAREVRELGELTLATLLVGDDPASDVYIRLKHKAAEEAGIRAVDKRLPEDTGEDEVLELIGALNDDDGIDGILVQTPLPPHMDEITVTDAVAAAKDVDGFNPLNTGRLYRGRPTLVPATAAGVMGLLDEYEIALAGRDAVVVGRSDRVGKPLAHLLLQRNATVTVCHSHTAALERHTLAADVLVVAVGREGLVSRDMVKRGATVVDVGMNRGDSGLVGDVDPNVAERAAYLTPVPGGVGPMTIAMVLRNTVQAARYRRRGSLAFPRT
jgi:methylenetetrahydrofolate dehydrogenase (NADP+) / methenyltetrahydrofolate cyclohydrolase